MKDFINPHYVIEICKLIRITRQLGNKLHKKTAQTEVL